MTSSTGDQAGKLSLVEPVFSSVARLVSRSMMNKPLDSPLAERYTSRLPSGDQLGKPLFAEPSVSTFRPLPSLPTTAMSAIAGPWIIWKKRPNPNAILSPFGDHTAATALLWESSNRSERFDPSQFIKRILLW